MQPYTYLLKFLLDNTFYYGVRYSESCHPSEFWVTYFTSSDYIEDLIKKHGKESFEFEIRRVFKTAEQAKRCERKILHKIDAGNNPKFINKGKPTSEKFTCSLFGNENPMRNWENVEKNKQALFDNHGVTNPGQLLHVRQKSKEVITKLNSRVVRCVWCGKEGGYINMLRYHGNNCKYLKPCPKGGVLRFLEDYNDNT